MLNLMTQRLSKTASKGNVVLTIRQGSRSAIMFTNPMNNLQKRFVTASSTAATKRHLECDLFPRVLEQVTPALQQQQTQASTIRNTNYLTSANSAKLLGSVGSYQNAKRELAFNNAAACCIPSQRPTADIAAPTLRAWGVGTAQG